MANSKSTRTSVESLSNRVEEFVVDKMGLPRFSLPYIGPKYVRNTTRRIMVICGYQDDVERSAFNNANYAVYGDFFYKNADKLIKNPKECRVNPYLLDNRNFDMSGLLEKIDEGMTVKDIVVHRFVPYPKIKDVEIVPDEVYKKAVDMFVGVVDICCPTHIFFLDESIEYGMNGDFNRFRNELLPDFFTKQYIVPIVGNADLRWNSYSHVDGGEDPSDDYVEEVPCFASDAMEFLDEARSVLDDPRLSLALNWDDEKIEYYGVDKKLFSRFKRNPEYVKKMLRDKKLPSRIRSGLILPFNNLKYGKILYTNVDCLFDVHGWLREDLEDSFEWQIACDMIALHDEALKRFADMFKKKRNALGKTKIMSLSSFLVYALHNLSEKLHIKYESRTLAELRHYIEELYNETCKLRGVSNPISLNHITEKQRLVRSMNIGRRWLDYSKEKTDASKVNAGNPPVTYNRKKISQKQLDHLARIRLKRWPKSEKKNETT